MAAMRTIEVWTQHWKSSNVLRTVAFVGLVSAAPFLGLASVSITNPASEKVSLGEVEQGVAAKYPVPNIASAEAARLIASGEAVLFDVREHREFDAGHLPGAIYVDPSETVDRFLAKHSVKLRGRVAVFYCSVGVRSSLLMERIAQDAAAYGPVALYNLKGGIFRWFAERRPVVDSNGPVDRIDPYDESWGRLLQRAMDARG